MYEDPLAKMDRAIGQVSADTSILRDQISEIEQRQIEIARAIGKQSSILDSVNWGLNIIFVAVVIVPLVGAAWRWLAG